MEQEYRLYTCTERDDRRSGDDAGTGWVGVCARRREESSSTLVIYFSVI